MGNRAVKPRMCGNSAFCRSLSTRANAVDSRVLPLLPSCNDDASRDDSLPRIKRERRGWNNQCRAVQT